MYTLAIIVQLLIQLTQGDIHSNTRDIQNGWYYSRLEVNEQIPKRKSETRGPIKFNDLIHELWTGHIDQDTAIYHEIYCPHWQVISSLPDGSELDKQLYDHLMQTGTSYQDLSLYFYRNKEHRSSDTAIGQYTALPALPPSVLGAIFFIIRMHNPWIQFSGQSPVIGGNPVDWTDYNYIQVRNQFQTPTDAVPEFILEYRQDGVDRYSLVIFFTGTNVNLERKLLDVHIDFDYDHREYGPLKLHRGVADKIFDSRFQKRLFDKIKAIKEHNVGVWDDQSLQLIIAGHSLGGGYAVVLFLLLYYVYPEMLEDIAKHRPLYHLDFPIEIAHDGFQEQLFPRVTSAYCVTFGAVLTVSEDSISNIPEDIRTQQMFNLIIPKDPVPKLLGGFPEGDGNAAVGLYFALPYTGFRTDTCAAKFYNAMGKGWPYGRRLMPMDKIAVQEYINNGAASIIETLKFRTRKVPKDIALYHFLATYSDACLQALRTSGLQCTVPR